MGGYLIDALLEPARRLVESAATLYTNNKAAALVELSSPEGDFVNGEHYVYVLDCTGVVLAHGANPAYVGHDFCEALDSEGKLFIQEILETADRDGSGIVEYKWLDPVSGMERPKKVFFLKTNDAIICSGVYGTDPSSSIQDALQNDITPQTPQPELKKFGFMHLLEPPVELLPNDAKELVQLAIAFLKIYGKEIAMAEFSNTRGLFVKGEQYVFVLDSTGRMLAHGITEKYVGKDFYRSVDSTGKSFIKEIVDEGNKESSGWVEYMWFNPLTKREELKTVYFEKTDGVIVCSGIYE